MYDLLKPGVIDHNDLEVYIDGVSAVGDGEVNVSDKMNLITHVIEEETEVFIPEVSDVNGDGVYDVSDAMGVIEIVLEDDAEQVNE